MKLLKNERRYNKMKTGIMCVLEEGEYNLSPALLGYQRGRDNETRPRGETKRRVKIESEMILKNLSRERAHVLVVCVFVLHLKCQKVRGYDRRKTFNNTSQITLT